LVIPAEQGSCPSDEGLASEAGNGGDGRDEGAESDTDSDESRLPAPGGSGGVIRIIAKHIINKIYVFHD